MNLFKQIFLKNQKDLKDQGIKYNTTILGEELGVSRQFAEFVLSHPEDTGINTMIKLGMRLGMSNEQIKTEFIRLKTEKMNRKLNEKEIS